MYRYIISVFSMINTWMGSMRSFSPLVDDVLFFSVLAVRTSVFWYWKLQNLSLSHCTGCIATEFDTAHVTYLKCARQHLDVPVFIFYFSPTGFQTSVLFCFFFFSKGKSKNLVPREIPKHLKTMYKFSILIIFQLFWLKFFIFFTYKILYEVLKTIT